MADGDGSPARERHASRQRVDTPGRAAEGESAPLEAVPGNDLRFLPEQPEQPRENRDNSAENGRI